MSKLDVGSLVNGYLANYSTAKIIQENEQSLADAITGIGVAGNGSINQEIEENDENILIGLSIIGSGVGAKRALKAFNS
jgi:hypothetical protein